MCASGGFCGRFVYALLRAIYEYMIVLLKVDELKLQAVKVQ